MWIVFNAAAAVVSGFIVAIMIGPVWLIPALVLFAGVTLLGDRWTGAQVTLYQAWNRFARRAAKAGFRWMMFLSHQVLLRAIGPEGSQFNAAPASLNRTAWSAYPVGFQSTSTHRSGGPVEEVTWKGWVEEYLRWATAGGNRWGVLLLPFLLGLSLFRHQDETSGKPSNIYTLF